MRNDIWKASPVRTEAVRCSVCSKMYSIKKIKSLVAHMRKNHRRDNEVSDSSDSESDKAEPSQVLTKVRRLGTTEKASRLPSNGTAEHEDVDNPNPRKASPDNRPDHQGHPQWNPQLRAAPNDRILENPEASADFASPLSTNEGWRGSDGKDERLQATSMLLTSKKRRRHGDDAHNPADNNTTKRVKVKGPS